ncbi:MAG: chromate resistance protein ChrB domain-containing protein [Usitatibacteraceae bacterium]
MDTAIAQPVSVSSLLASMSSTSSPLVIDVRRTPAFAADTGMLAGATWRDPFLLEDWIKLLPRDRDIVVYCVHGHEISKNACVTLRNAGFRASFVEGGIEAWKAAGAPTIRKAAALCVPSPPNEPTIWITRERPKIDRIACPWLIRRFIDPLAEFVYVPAADVMSQAEVRSAIPYDVPHVQFSHRGEACSFDAFVADFEIADPALHDLAVIVRGADTGKPELTPQSPGLLAVSLGLSALHPNDHEMLEHGMVVYDALYAWLKRARAEVHNADLFVKS